MVSVKIMDITPDVAREMLKHNSSNRNITPMRVAQYVKDMQAGRWHENGEPFTICKGKLYNGQHRLTAAIKANATIKNAIIAYVDDVEMIDSGKGRTNVDRLKLAGYDVPRVIASAVSAAINFNYGKGSSGTDMLTEKYLQWENEIKWLKKKFPTGKKGVTKAGILAAILVAKVAGYDDEKLDDFCNVLITGVTVKACDVTIITLRDFAMTQSTVGSISQSEAYAKTQFALKAYENNRIQKRLQSDKHYYTTNGLFVR